MIFYQRRVDRLTQSNWSDPRSQSHIDGLLESQGRLDQLLLQGDLIADNILISVAVQILAHRENFLPI